MGLYQKVRELWKQPKKNMGEAYKEKLISWRRQPTTVKVERPTRIDRARSVGYKAKQGIIVVRQRVIKSKRMREKFSGGRRPKASRRKKVVAKNYQQISEERAQKKYVNLRVLNSYWVASDGQNHWHEIILVDPEHPVIKADKNLNWICDPVHRGRANRGLTSAGRKSRGLRKKGTGSEKTRPSQRANLRRGH
ncbi:50S ribosomal protein L15e [Candidatus Woesearchaeota archaeon]|nr:50S ribosomal protein L15e [Candidatus Woesearchaeota archaeon]